METSKRLEVMEVTGMDAGAVLFFWRSLEFSCGFCGSAAVAWQFWVGAN